MLGFLNLCKIILVHPLQDRSPHPIKTLRTVIQFEKFPIHISHAFSMFSFNLETVTQILNFDMAMLLGFESNSGVLGLKSWDHKRCVS